MKGKKAKKICPMCGKPYLEKRIITPPDGKKIIYYVHDLGTPEIRHAPGLNAIITMNHTDGCYDETQENIKE
jgi:hypothetical protein